MLAFTPEVEAWLRWFDETHELTMRADGSWYYRRIALPRAGGLGDQDAVLLEGLTLLETIHHALVRDGRRQKAH